MFTTLFLSFLSASFLIGAYYPEIVYLNRTNKLEASQPLNAHTTWKLTKMAEHQYYANLCNVFGYLSTKTSVLRLASIIIFLIALAYIFITVPIEMPYLLSIVMGSYLWIGAACKIMQFIMRKYRMSVGLSLALAIIIPAIIFALIYPISLLAFRLTPLT